MEDTGSKRWVAWLILAGCLMACGFDYVDLPYGWKAISGVPTNVNASIYNATNVRKQVTQPDVIPLFLGTAERCYTTMYGTQGIVTSVVGNVTNITTNGNQYYVVPPSLVFSFVSTNVAWPTGTAYWVCYTNYWPSTEGVSVVHSYTTAVLSQAVSYVSSWTMSGGWVWATNSAWPEVAVTSQYVRETNVIGWSIDRNSLISLDTAIKALVPYFVDTDSVYDGASVESVNLTVTGLFASLGIGDHTNQFTSKPGWTNIVTNWVINYTSCYPYTNNLVWVTNTYTAAENQTVSWATNYSTNLQAWQWTTNSSWPSIVFTLTNAASNGVYSWHIYRESLEERYKVLASLQMTDATFSRSRTNNQARYALGVSNVHSQGAYDELVGIFESTSWSNYYNSIFGYFGIGAYLSFDANPPADMLRCQGKPGVSKMFAPVEPLLNESKIYIYIGVMNYDFGCTNAFYVLDGLSNAWDLLTTIDSTNDLPYTGPLIGALEDPLELQGFNPTNDFVLNWTIRSMKMFTTWQYLYCTNKYW